MDNIAAFELVLPNGTVTTVTEEDEDLWFALRGGGNNFVRCFESIYASPLTLCFRVS